MCYLPSIRSRSCRFGPAVLHRKVVQECVFCHQTRTAPASRYRDDQKANPGTAASSRYNRPCPALTRPGHTIVEVDLETARRWMLTPLIMVETARDGRVVAVEVLREPAQGPGEQGEKDGR